MPPTQELKQGDVVFASGREYIVAIPPGGDDPEISQFLLADPCLSERERRMIKAELPTPPGGSARTLLELSELDQ